MPVDNSLLHYTIVELLAFENGTKMAKTLNRPPGGVLDLNKHWYSVTATEHQSCGATPIGHESMMLGEKV
jgi:hypothetical protein